MQAPAPCWQILAWGMLFAAGCLINSNLLALGSSWFGFMAIRTVTLSWHKWIIFGLLIQKQKKNISVFALVVIYMGR